MTKHNLRSNKLSFLFNIEDIFHILGILVILFLVESIKALILGFILNVDSITVEEIIQMNTEDTSILNSIGFFQTMKWFFSIPFFEIFKALIYGYCIVVTFLHDLIYEPYPKFLPITLLSAFVTFSLAGAFEIIGANLIIVILVIILLSFVSTPVIASSSYIGSGIVQITVYSGLGAAITGAVLGFILPIVSAIIIVLSILQYFGLA